MRETDGGNYHPDLAENCYLHLREGPRVEIRNDHDDRDEGSEPMSDTAKAICVASVIAVCIACAAAAIWHGV